MIDESSDGDWASRRNPGIRRPIAGIGKTSTGGIPYLAPEIQLVYKAKNPARRTRPTSPPSFPPSPANNGNGSATRSHEPTATTHGETGLPRLRQQAANHDRASPGGASRHAFGQLQYPTLPLDGARQGAPDADQVADRWHIYHNLCEHAEKAVARHRDCLKEPAPEPEETTPGERDPGGLVQLAADAAAQRAEDSVLSRRTKQSYEQVQALRAQGLGIKPIMRQTGLAKETVRRFYRATTVDELLARTRDRRPSVLDEYKPYLYQRWNDGCTNVRQLHAELRERGYRGSYGTIRDYVEPFRDLGAAPPATPAPPKARDVARWILSDPEHLDDAEKSTLVQVRDRCPHLDALAAHVTEFAKILTGLKGDQLDAWIAAVEADDQPDLHSFARGLRHDHDAVVNGLTLPWSSGVVEGNVNRIKMIKRQMYGRAGFPLLRRRVLLAT
jgi:transposase